MREATGSGAVGASSTRAATGLALMAFLVGMPRYRIFTVQGSSALLEIFRVYVAAIRNRNLQLPENPDELYEISRSKAAPEVEFVSHRDRPFRFLDRAAIVQAPTAETPSPWRQCRVTHVEHAKTVLAMVPIFCSAIIMGTCLAQFQYLLHPAGLHHEHHLFVPFARGVTGHPNGIPYLQRVGVGVVLSIVSMCIAVVVEMYRKKVAVWNGMLDAIPMVPPALKSMSTYIGLLVDLFFWLLAMLSFINFLNYLYWASWYKYVKPQDEDENVDEQQV
ncbi:hypothetical protein ZWY2020_031226 [Hordeum vulgare]|nr:hypothetical protein ZWY2020_031226 [Hordeum vulgare]